MVKMAHHGNKTHQHAARALLFKQYIDDISDSCSDKELLKLTCTEIDDLIGQFGFSVKDWISNHPEIGTTRKSKKILGINYDIEKDNLQVFINAVKEGKCT